MPEPYGELPLRGPRSFNINGLEQWVCSAPERCNQPRGTTPADPTEVNLR
jgi:hypothetical protein